MKFTLSPVQRNREAISIERVSFPFVIHSSKIVLEVNVLINVSWKNAWGVRYKIVVESTNVFGNLLFIAVAADKNLLHSETISDLCFCVCRPCTVSLSVVGKSAYEFQIKLGCGQYSKFSSGESKSNIYSPSETHYFAAGDVNVSVM